MIADDSKFERDPLWDFIGRRQHSLCKLLVNHRIVVPEDLKIQAVNFDNLKLSDDRQDDVNFLVLL